MQARAQEGWAQAVPEMEGPDAGVGDAERCCDQAEGAERRERCVWPTRCCYACSRRCPVLTYACAGTYRATRARRCPVLALRMPLPIARRCLELTRPMALRTDRGYGYAATRSSVSRASVSESKPVELSGYE
eukprot:93293-Rhodomonas_salina.2